ncbi:hypothetical protein KVF89_27170 [Nocardioides carbamazepini]|uniref:baeRF2 domain-containing protein n=1 Tax=Nocardioides carbamazepini TaxID=2854259 RepID=UPI00214A31BF|nr:Vms1/Ankzf1 family peptidyl-tRNA hydrolase [Nocardioides carbamazepini]MCR1786243.1 hypothetical protein [Nocardioides carbamazepini]
MRLDTIRPIYESAGPFVTLHLDVSRDSEDARQQLDARWTTARHELERLETGARLRAELEERFRAPTHLAGPARRTLVAAGDEVLLDDVRAGTGSWPESVVAGPLPDLAPWLAMADGQVPFMVVRADRVGADLELYLAANQAATDELSVDGSTLHLTKVPDGDWAQDRYQQRSENQWHENARLAVEAIEDVLARHEVRAVFVAGDVRARSDIAGMLEQRDDLAVVVVEAGGRAAGASDDALWQEVRPQLAALQAREIDDLAQRLARGLAVAEGVVTGPDAVADALARGAVDHLVLELGDARAVRLTPEEHPGLALPDSALSARELPADLVLLGAAALTDAAASVVPSELPLPRELALASGTAALLRWDDRSPS